MMRNSLIIFVILLIWFMPVRAIQGEIPEPAPLIESGEYDILNILLLGSDTSNPRNVGRTDVIMIASFNRTAGTVALISIPRDLYVYIPDWGMQRINTAMGYGETSEKGSGPTRLMDTIRYNLGLEVHYYARVDFNGFRQIIDSIGGVEIAVDCGIEDWRLLEPSLDPNLEESWGLYTLPIGIHTLNGDDALWYVRSRRTSSDLDRGRRQQVIIRAIWGRAKSLGLFNQMPYLWQQIIATVDTDLNLDDLLTLIPIALQLDNTRMLSLTFRQNIEVVVGRSPEGASILIPQEAAIASLVDRLYQPVIASRAFQNSPTIEIVNASGNRSLGQVAAERLAWEGFMPVIAPESDLRFQQSRIIDFTGQTKGSSADLLQDILRVADEFMFNEPDPERIVDYQVILGSSYYACTYGVRPPSG